MPSIHSSVSTRFCVRRQSTVGTRKRPSGRCVLGDVVGHLGDGGRLQPQVHLDLDRVGERVDHGHRPQAPRRRMKALDLAGGEEVAVEVAAEALLDAGAQHLDGHRPRHAVVDRHRLVNLGDRSSGDRRPELGEVILQPATQRRLCTALRASFIENGGSLSCRRLGPGEFGADQVATRGQELAELDVAGPQARQGVGDTRLLRPADAQRPGQGADRQRGNTRRLQDPRGLSCQPARSARRAGPARCRRGRGAGCWRGRRPSSP